MNKSARFFSFTLFSFLTFFGQAFISSAQEGEEVVMSDTRYAAVSVSDAHVLDFADKSGLSVSVKVKNLFPESRTYQVGIEFRGISEENKGELFVWRMPEEFYLEGTSEQPLSFVMSNPQHLAGKYRLTLGMNDRRGNVVAMVSLGEKEFSHAGRVSLRNCAFLGDRGVIELSKLTEPFGTCEVVWDGAEDGLARVMTQIASTRYGTPKVVGESKTIMKPETTTLGNVVISEPVEPGNYQLEIVPVATGGYPIGVPIKKTLVIPGEGGNLKGVTRFESGKSFAPKEVVPVVAQLELYDTGKYDLLLELMSQGQSCATPIRASIEGQPNIYEGEFKIDANCAMPEVRATLSFDGKQIDQLANGNNDMPMQEGKDEKMMAGVPEWVLWGGAGVLAMLLLYVLTKRRNRTNRVMMPMFFLLFSVSIFLGFDTKQVEAGSANFQHGYICGGSCPRATAIWSNYDTDKDTYAPGETIQVSMRIGSDDSPQGSCIGPVARLGLNGAAGADLVPDCYSPQDIRGDLSFNFSISAPIAAGPFNLTVTSGMTGYSTPSSPIDIPLTVSGTPPTVTLSAFSPQSIQQGQSSAISLSATNANSCSGDAGSLWTDNLGGTDFSNQSTGPMNTPGTYTQRVTCTGPGGSASSATQTLTVNPAPVPSGNFTSTPSCTIAANASGCNTTLGWTSTNTSTVVLTNCGGASLSSGGTGTQSASGIYVPYNSGCYQIRNGSASGPILAQTNVTSSCTSGTSWEGSRCAAAATTASFTSGPSCVIAAGEAGCNTTLSWTASNVSTLSLTNCQSSALGGSNDVLLTSITSSGPGSFGPVYVPYNAGCYRLHEGGVTGPILDQITVSSSCTSGTAYNGLNQGGIWHSGVCAPTTGAPTVDITATGPVSLESQTWWQKALSWVMGEKVTAAGNATITTSQNANISWASSGASNCNVSGPLISSSLRNNTSGQNVSGASLGVGTHTYTIQCNNANGSAQATATVTVSGGSGSTVVCGNGIREGAETCDNGALNNSCPNTCSSLCTLNSCGGSAVNGVCGATHNNCSSGNSVNPTQDTTTWYWDCQGFSGGTSTSCSEAKGACTPTWNPTTTSCAGAAGQYGIPATHTYGIANLSINSCTGGTVYNGGCSVPPACSPTSNTWNGACSTYAGTFGIPATHTVGTANFSYDTCWMSTYTGGCSAPNCNDVIATFTIACSAAAGEVGIPWNYTVGTATVGVTSCGTTRYLGGCSLPPGAPQYTIFATYNLGGAVSPAGYIRNIPQGSSRTFTITPDAGYVVASVTIDGVNQGAVNSVTINNIQNNHIIRATFAAAPAGPSGQIGTVTPCTIPQGGSTCTSQISWTTSDLVPITNNPALQVVGGTPFSVSGMTGTNQSFTVGEGSHVVTLRDLNTGTVYDTDTLVASCVAGTTWVGGLCQAVPTVSLTVNGSGGPISVAPGDTLTLDWTVSGATGCTASGKWSGAKSTTGGTENTTAAVPSGDYILTCTNSAGINTVDTVTVNLACTPSVSSWSACGPPCAGGDGTRWRTVTTAACGVTTEEESCTTTTCRDLNWKEVGQ